MWFQVSIRDTWPTIGHGAPRYPALIKHGNGQPIYFHDSPKKSLHLSHLCGTFQLEMFDCHMSVPIIPHYFPILSFYPHIFTVFILIPPKKHLWAIDSPFLVDIPLPYRSGKVIWSKIGNSKKNYLFEEYFGRFFLTISFKKYLWR